MVDIIMIRTHDHDEVEELAKNSSVPVINGLTERFHPCQLLADMQTYFEEKGSIEGKKVAWVGDGCNMCNSYINAAKILNFHLKIATPSGFEPDQSTLNLAKNNVELCDMPGKAVEDCDLVTTDVWSSMGDETEADKIGVYIMAIAGYNPEEASKLWERMKANSEGKKSPPAFLSTHPSNDSRIENLRALAPSAKAEAEKFGVTSFRKN